MVYRNDKVKRLLKICVKLGISLQYIADVTYRSYSAVKNYSQGLYSPSDYEEFYRQTYKIMMKEYEKLNREVEKLP